MTPTGRRGLLRSLVHRSSAEAQEPELPARRRPPGAVSEAQFLAGCTACMACVEACPQRAIHTLVDGVGLGARTPVMVPDARACTMCEGFPCITACDEGVLLPFEGSAWWLGTVVVDPTRCLPFRGPECGACQQRCPTGVDALRIVRNRPVIDELLCVGCGLCIEACPIRPAALELLPL